MRGIIMALAVVGSLLTAGSAPAQESAQSAESAFLAEMFGAEPFPEDRFAPAFLQQVPYERVRQIIAEIKATIGPVFMVRGLGGPEYLVITKTHDLPVTLMLDANNDIAGLLFKPAVDRTSPIEDLFAAFDVGIPYSYLVMKDGEVLYGHEVETRLAVGSAFKLGVLAALKRQIDEGQRSWDDVVTLEPGHISLPSGILQDWPVGLRLTLQTLASLMISISDNTATDALLATVGRETVGRETVEAVLGQPVLSTRELFQLKADASMRAQWIGGDSEAKRGVSAELVGRDLPGLAAVSGPHDQGAEWYLSARELCTLIEDVGGLDVMHINPGLASRADWSEIAFKGGSEVGVLNLTSQLVGKDGASYCVAVTWNGPAALNEQALAAAYGNVIGRLARPE